VDANETLITNNFVFAAENGVFTRRMSGEDSVECSYRVESQNDENYCVETEVQREPTEFNVGTVHQLEQGSDSYPLDRNAMSSAENSYYIENTCEDGGQAVDYQYVTDDTYAIDTNPVDGTTELYQIVEPSQSHSYELESEELDDGRTVTNVNVNTGDPRGLVIHCVEYVDNNDRSEVEQSQVFAAQSDLEMTVEEHTPSVEESSCSDEQVNGSSSSVLVSIPVSKSSGSGGRPYIMVPSSLLQGLQNQQLVVTAGKTGQSSNSSPVVYQIANASSLIQSPIQLKCFSRTSGQ